jgi:hypothetical protein
MNGLSIHLPDGVPKSKHVAARGFRGSASRVLAELILVRV